MVFGVHLNIIFKDDISKKKLTKLGPNLRTANFFDNNSGSKQILPFKEVVRERSICRQSNILNGFISMHISFRENILNNPIHCSRIRFLISDGDNFMFT